MNPLIIFALSVVIAVIARKMGLNKGLAIALVVLFGICLFFADTFCLLAGVLCK